MDGFTLLEELKKDPLAAHIPVIVVSAKDLTPEDERRLAGQTSSIWLKGSFSTHDLVDHVVTTLSDSNGDDTVVSSSPHQNEKQSTPQDEVTSPQSTTFYETKKVVLIEDNPTDARLISRILQSSRPLDIKQVQTGEDAIEVIKAEAPHLIVLDLLMPDKSGFQILEELRNNKELDAIPVIVITAKDLSEREKQSLKFNGVRSMWQKGRLDREKLIAHVEAQLEE
jgi:CheY-like chemotaxis protein